MASKVDPERIAAWPRLTRFYGISPLELARTPNVILGVYIEQLPELEAQEQLLAFQAADYPHVDIGDRREWHSKLVAMANLPEPEIDRSVDMTTADGRRVLHGLGIKVVAG